MTKNRKPRSGFIFALSAFRAVAFPFRTLSNRDASQFGANKGKCPFVAIVLQRQERGCHQPRVPFFFRPKFPVVSCQVTLCSAVYLPFFWYRMLLIAEIGSLRSVRVLCLLTCWCSWFSLKVWIRRWRRAVWSLWHPAVPGEQMQCLQNHSRLLQMLCLFSEIYPVSFYPSTNMATL